MPSNDDYRPHFNFEITEEQKKRVDRLMSQYGLHRAIFSRVLDDVLDLIEEYGGPVIGVLMSGNLKPRDIIPIMHQAEEAGKK